MESNYELIYKVSNDLIIAKVDVLSLKEQSLNARMMNNDMFKQLESNIKKRGALESLPFCALDSEGKIEIISGHHRVRACREAGIKEIPVILDISGLTKSQIVAKQLAHNSLSGKDDEGILLELYNMMDNIDDKLESFIDVNEINNDRDSLSSINLDDKVDFKSIHFLFTDKEIKDIDKLMERLETESSDGVYVCRKEDFETLVNAIEKTKKIEGVRNTSLAMVILCKKLLEMENKNEHNK